jgi:hypothetical protein
LKEKRDLIRHEMKSSIEECEAIQNEFNSIKDNVQKMVRMFVKAKFRSTVANKMSYDEETLFNEHNIKNYLAELEEYIANLIMTLAFQRDDPNAPISSIPLEKLN